MPKLADVAAEIRDALMVIHIRAIPMELPKYRFDGEECDEKDIASALGITEYEARIRKLVAEEKDVYSDQASHDVQVGIGTTMQRINKFIQRKKRKRRKKTR